MLIRGRFKAYFLRGLAVLLPSILTIWIFVLIYAFIKDRISIHINKGLVELILRFEGGNGIGRERLTEILVEGTAGSVVGVFFFFNDTATTEIYT